MSTFERYDPENRPKDDPDAPVEEPSTEEPEPETETETEVTETETTTERTTTEREPRIDRGEDGAELQTDGMGRGEDKDGE